MEILENVQTEKPTASADRGPAETQWLASQLTRYSRWRSRSGILYVLVAKWRTVDTEGFYSEWQSVELLNVATEQTAEVSMAEFRLWVSEGRLAREQGIET